MEKIIKMINKKKGIDDEICVCNHSKGYHGHLGSKEHHGKCEMCSCKNYIYKKFVRYKDWSAQDG